MAPCRVEFIRPGRLKSTPQGDGSSGLARRFYCDAVPGYYHRPPGKSILELLARGQWIDQPFLEFTRIVLKRDAGE
jgi:hypothetical protein